jgi:hypothetical protein
MNKSIARIVAGPLAAAGLAAGTLGFAAVANADTQDPVQAAPDLFSAHSDVIFAHAHFISEPDRVAIPGAKSAKLQKAPSAEHHFTAVHHAR